MTVRRVLLGLHAMLTDPDPFDGVLNFKAAWTCLEDLERFRARAGSGGG